MKHMTALPDSVTLPEPATVGIRELKQNASAVVARAAAGETLTITDRGRPVARILPLERKSHLQQMIDDGRITVPEHSIADYIKDHTVDGKYVPPVTLRGDGPTLSQVLMEMREEERH